jgi:hypothetical protein
MVSPKDTKSEAQASLTPITICNISKTQDSIIPPVPPVRIITVTV